VAVGECGLDYHYMNSEREDQRRAFAAQVALARELDLPVSIHVRDDGPTAYDELLAIWCEVGGGQTRGVLHCYTGTLAFAKRALEHDFFVSFSGILTFKRSTELRDVARGLPLERLLVETDAPFLAPEGHRGKRNEPAWVARVGETLAEVLGRSLEETAAITRENTQALFGLDPGATLPARSPEAPAPQEDA
jgi:TatD DNase family protein